MREKTLSINVLLGMYPSDIYANRQDAYVGGRRHGKLARKCLDFSNVLFHCVGAYLGVV